MKDPIERQEAIDAINDLPDCPNGYSDTYDKSCIIGVLEELPSAESEIIRYKDCIYYPIVPENWNGSKYSLEWPVGEDGLDNCPCHCPDDYYSWVPDEDWFCGNGKKRREQNEL